MGLPRVLPLSLHSHTPLPGSGQQEVTLPFTISSCCSGNGQGCQGAHREQLRRAGGDPVGCPALARPRGSGIMAAKGKTHGGRMWGRKGSETASDFQDTKPNCSVSGSRRGGAPWKSGQSLVYLLLPDLSLPTMALHIPGVFIRLLRAAGIPSRKGNEGTQR